MALSRVGKSMIGVGMEMKQLPIFCFQLAYLPVRVTSGKPGVQGERVFVNGVGVPPLLIGRRCEGNDHRGALIISYPSMKAEPLPQFPAPVSVENVSIRHLIRPDDMQRAPNLQDGVLS